jgi:hypothetical protein
VLASTVPTRGDGGKTFGAIELRRLLLSWWDPIRVHGVREARDE